MKAIRLHARGGPESLRFEDDLCLIVPNLVQQSLLFISGFAFPGTVSQGVVPKGMTGVLATRVADYFAA